MKALKPKIKKSQHPTLTGKPPLGHLISFHCPKCDKHILSAYESDMRTDRVDGYKWSISDDLNYCSKCGQLLDLEEYRFNNRFPNKNLDDEIVFDD